MYISKINIEGYKSSKNNSEILLNKGLNILVGENASGKTTIIDSIRLVLKENEFSYLNISEDDFYKAFNTDEEAEQIKIDATFDELNPEEQVTFLTWCDSEFKGHLHFEVDRKLNRKGYYKKSIWGGMSKASAFEDETFEYIDCIYLPPLRDAEEKLTNGRKSRLATLLKHQYKDDEAENELVKKVTEFNNDITNNKNNSYKEIAKAKDDINNNIKNSMGDIFGQSINLQFAEVSFNKILENIKMVFFPQLGERDIKKFRDIAINSLGYNNLLYIATVFAELQTTGREKELFTVLLIEEPEAHLHPQLQVKLIKYLDMFSKEHNNIQIILTTHSPILASSVSVDCLIHISQTDNEIKAIPLNKINYGDSKNYINRWLDVTKSTLLFSKGIILVEGISESMLIPELAKICLCQYNQLHKGSILPATLEEAGVSVININGINFKHFMRLFCDFDKKSLEISIPIRYSGVTDNDPEKDKIECEHKDGKEIIKNIEKYPDWKENIEGKNSALSLKSIINSSNYARLYSSPLKTFEYDLAMQGNVLIMAQALENVWTSDSGKIISECKSIINNYDSNNLWENSKFIHQRASDKKLGKGMFAQELADLIQEKYNDIIKKLDNNNEDISSEIVEIFKVPDYIYKAVIWACGGEVDE